MFELYVTRLALQHMLDILRHVGSSDFMKDLEFPTVNLKLPILKFNNNLPPPPMVMDTDGENQQTLLVIVLITPISVSRLLAAVKSGTQLLMQHYQKEVISGEIDEAMLKFQQAMIEDSVRDFRPHVPSFDFD
jgi:hypothetical protein